MRKGSTYIALCGLLVACAIVVPASAGAAIAPRAHAASSKSKHTASPKLGSIHMKLLGTSTNVLLTDGTRWAAYEPTKGVTRLMDTATGHTINRPDPEGCVDGLAAIGSGEALYECDDPECPEQARNCKIPSPPEEGFESKRYIVENINSGAQHVVQGTSHVPVGYTNTTFSLDEVGTQWVGGIQKSKEYRGHGVGIFVNWHTGKIVYEAQKPSFSDGGVIEEEPPSAEEEVENLSSTRLMQPLCPPVMRPKNNEEEALTQYGLVSYERPFAVVGPVGRGGTGFHTPAVPLQIQRCENDGHMKLPGGAEYGPGAFDVQLGNYVLSWILDVSFKEVSYVTRLYPRGHRWHGLLYRLANLPKGGETSVVDTQHTASRVFATVGKSIRNSAGTVSYELSIYSARLPWLLTHHKGSDQ